ncbi:MAG: hypothetical protein MHMPM18_000885 [Marteilia pararefringens]
MSCQDGSIGLKNDLTLAILKMKGGNFREALFYHEKALTLNPGHNKINSAMVECLLMLNKNRDVIDYLQKNGENEEKTNEERIQDVYLMSLAQYQNEEFEEAMHNAQDCAANSKQKLDKYSKLLELTKAAILSSVGKNFRKHRPRIHDVPTETGSSKKKTEILKQSRNKNILSQNSSFENHTKKFSCDEMKQRSQNPGYMSKDIAFLQNLLSSKPTNLTINAEISRCLIFLESKHKFWEKQKPSPTN